jgi:hypothetical protein
MSNREKPSQWFCAQTSEKSSQWFWGQTTDKLSNLVLRLNKETHASHLLIHGADRTQRHPTSRSPGHRVPDLCSHPRSSAPGLLPLPWSSSLPTMLYLPPAHHETSKHDSPHNTKDKGKTTEMSRIQIQTSPSQWLITIKPRNWPLRFSLSRNRLGGMHDLINVWNLRSHSFACGSSQAMYRMTKEHLACHGLRQTRVSEGTRYPKTLEDQGLLISGQASLGSMPLGSGTKNRSRLWKTLARQTEQGFDLSGQIPRMTLRARHMVSTVLSTRSGNTWWKIQTSRAG